MKKTIIAFAVALCPVACLCAQNGFSEHKPKVYAVADAHLDTQWNWDIQTTIKDYVWNTLYQNLFLLKHYPDYVFNFEYQLPNIHAPKNIQDLDKDGIKEFGLDFYELGVNIFIEVHNDGLKIDYLNPIYNQRFNSLDTINEKDDFQFMQYLVYGNLAKRLDNKQSDKMYVGYIRESNYKLKQLITNVRRIKELAVEYKVANNVMEYLMWDMEQKALFNLLDKKGNSTEFKQRILLLDEQLKLLKIDEVILNDLSTYIGGYLSDKEFADILTRAVVPIYKDIKLMLSNILTLDNILHKYGYKIIYLKASI